MNKKQIEDTKKERETHPEYQYLKGINHEGMITLKFSNRSYSTNSADSQILREEFCELLMYNIRQKLKLRKLDWEWWGCSEYGTSGEGHCHIIFSFHPLQFKGKRIPSLNGFYDLALESAEHIRETLDLPRKCIDVHWLPANDQGFVGYFCKKENRHEDYKHFFKFKDSERIIDIMIEEYIEDEKQERMRIEAEEEIRNSEG